ncbi:2,5-dioxovalerate dehydrogenase [Massilia sp. WF1]|uniref:aldehyde dehydrogenase (NADP(+)) n=1 Tax=unclassified Massilia TaxID=2609279 RepID=UPI0006908525|nr:MULTISPECIES: aldehyde dehydrogenase (NADP(+)) [unclassified Massilia]ALK97595.1 2,5-dioxovalerate dehydrogenase [Massilia sp. WG5]KNZ67870.1 2,5-dioxovalerate dehydrogenase [Massilia sp. WF1]
MTIQGEMIIGRRVVRGSAGSLRAFNPATRAEMEPAFGLATALEVEAACALAEQAFDAYRNVSLERRARFLETIADRIMDIGPALVERASQESGLPAARIEGERGRTCNQLRLFAKVVRDGHFLEATLDSALPQRTPPRPDLRMRKIALGPVAVFGASNFPLAFSVAGGDTASALAAGCPVVVKAHSAHPGTSELVGKAVLAAAIECDMPEGVFSMLIGEGRQVGQALVANPAIKAVGFTGSRQGGMALVHTASARKEPIPVYAEMSSINPFYLLPGALAGNTAKLGQGFIDSLTMGVGQFCTNPGLVIGLAGADFDAFRAAAAQALQAKSAGTMLTAGIHKAYTSAIEKRSGIVGVELVGQGSAEGQGCAAQGALYQTNASTFLANPDLEEEIFGPASLMIACRDEAELLAVTNHVEGQLTATVHASAADRLLAAKLLPVLERKAGRILFNGYPTGVEVCHAMVHGGPFPATSDTRSTSVGATAIERFLRPVCYQDLPADLLPEALRDDNPLGLTRMVDGQLQVAG